MLFNDKHLLHKKSLTAALRRCCTWQCCLQRKIGAATSLSSLLAMSASVRQDSVFRALNDFRMLDNCPLRSTCVMLIAMLMLLLLSPREHYRRFQ